MERNPTDGASGAGAREADSKTDRQKQILLAGRILNLTSEGAERFHRSWGEPYGWESVSDTLVEMRRRQDAGEVFRKPLTCSR